MRAIAPRTIRLTALALIASLASMADTHADVVDVFASMAAALSDDNASQFMKAFDRNMPEYGRLETQVTALVNNSQAASSVDPLKDEGDERKRDVEVDWYLELKSRLQVGPLVQRRAMLHCQLEKQGKHWRIVSMKPLEFFDASQTESRP